MIESYVRTKPPSVTDRSKVSRWRKKTAEKVCVQQNCETSGRASAMCKDVCLASYGMPLETLKI
jgi:hypothetical protein